MKDKYFCLFFSIYLFWEPILFSILAALSANITSILMRLMLVIIFLVSLHFFFSYKSVSERRPYLVVFFILGFLYYLTHFFYDDTFKVENFYYGYFLRWGSDCLSACMLGAVFINIRDFSLMHKSLPFIATVLTPFMMKTIMDNQVEMIELKTENGFNYQNIAYFFAIMSCISLYYSLISKYFKSKRVRFFLLLMAFIQIGCCAMSGGRGGFALLIVYFAYLTFVMKKRNVLTAQQMFLIVILSALGVGFVAYYLGIVESSGFSRAQRLTLDEERAELYLATYKVITESPILGHGLGSVWFTVGFYTHNVFLDLLVETGLIGLLIILNVYIRVLRKVVLLTTYDDSFFVIMIFFIYGLVMNLVTGYWISTFSIWLALGCALSFKKYWKLNKQSRVIIS